MQTTRKLRLMASIVGVLVIMVSAVSISSGAPASPGAPTVQTTCVANASATGPTTVNVPVRIQGLADLGAAGFTMFLEAHRLQVSPQVAALVPSSPLGVQRLMACLVSSEQILPTTQTAVHPMLPVRTAGRSTCFALPTPFRVVFSRP